MDRICRDHAKRNARSAAMITKMGGNREGRIFSGARSETMWKLIGEAEDIEDMKAALYVVCCRMQEFETRLEGAENAKVPGETIKLVFPEDKLEMILEEIKADLLKMVRNLQVTDVPT